jgi:hypothetical protein
MNFGQAIALGFSKYLDFTGRASRSEFWFWVLFAVIGAMTTNTLDAAIFVYHNGVSPLNSPLSNIFTIVALLPSPQWRPADFMTSTEQGGGCCSCSPALGLLLCYIGKARQARLTTIGLAPILRRRDI